MDIEKFHSLSFCLSACGMFTMAAIHLYFTLHDALMSNINGTLYFAPSDPNVINVMRNTSLAINSGVNLWNAYGTTHIMQVLGAVFFGSLVIIVSYVWFVLSKLRPQSEANK